MTVLEVILSFAGGLGSLWFTAMLVARALRAAQRRRAMTVLAFVEQAMRLNAPLSEFLRAAALGEAGRVQADLRSLAEMLASGVDVPVAILAVAPRLPRRSLELISAAWRSHNTPATLRRIITEERGKLVADPVASLYLRWYPLIFLTLFWMMLGAIGIFVFPKYANIFSDFHVPLPRITRSAMDLTAGAGPIIGLIATAWLVAWTVFRATRAEGNGPGWIWSRIAWQVPFIGAATRGRALADATGVMADALAAGRPMLSALDEASNLRSDPVLRRRLMQWADHVHAGVSLNEAARQAGMPALVSGALGMAQISGGEEEALRFLQRHYAGIFSRGAIVLRAAMVPLIAVCMGAAVLFAGLAMFEPLITLINTLTPKTGGL